MLITISRIISYLVHPLWIPLTGVVLILKTGIYEAWVPKEIMQWILTVVVLCTLLIPLIVIPFMMLLGAGNSMKFQNNRIRVVLYFVASISYYIAFYLITRYSTNHAIAHFLLGAFFSAFFVAAITMFWRISAHMMAIGGLAGFVLALSVKYYADLMLLFSGLLVLAGIVGTTRLLLKEHNLGQVSAGFFAGFLILFFSLFVY
jgi:hypothetical protein